MKKTILITGSTDGIGKQAAEKLAKAGHQLYLHGRNAGKLAKSEPGLNVIAVNPGSLLDTKMVREGFGRSWSPASKGADILYQLALSDRHSEASGKYFDNDRGDFSRAHPDAYNEMKVDQLIRITNDLLTT